MPQKEKPKVHASPSVAIVGRKNVGKSSLFNRLIEDNQAIVSDTPGTTRDVGIGMARWRGQLLTLLDTGGTVSDREMTTRGSS